MSKQIELLEVVKSAVFPFRRITFDMTFAKHEQGKYKRDADLVDARYVFIYCVNNCTMIPTQTVLDIWDYNRTMMYSINRHVNNLMMSDKKYRREVLELMDKVDAAIELFRSKEIEEVKIQNDNCTHQLYPELGCPYEDKIDCEGCKYIY